MMRRTIFGIALLSLICAGCGNAQQKCETVQPESWTATDALGRRIGPEKEYPAERPGKTVGMFYFIWQGAHGYDRHHGGQADEGVMPITEADSVSPYDISRMLLANPDNPAYGPVHAFHYWGEPYLGYYLANDEWVIRKHAQMISDAGVDVIILDVTNAAIYLPQVLKICEVYTRMRGEGNKTPDISFIINSKPDRTLTRLYESFFKKGLYSNLWFYWKGKPLVLCPPEGVTPETAEFFTIRHAWFSSHWPWFEDGKDKWAWADHYPQKAGWHEDPSRPEEVSVCAATHPTSNIGRSFHDGKQPAPGEFRSGEGAHFAEQFEHALAVDPEFIFITGWNEWVAMRFTDGAAQDMLGKKISKGETYFVDQYNEEYSRDIEPMRGGFGDNYYYQMTDFIRRYKGVPAEKVYSREASIPMDGRMDAWRSVAAVYRDDSGDTAPRSHPGWGRIGLYEDFSGRNDILESRVSCDGEMLNFYVRTAGVVSPSADPQWMQLFLATDGGGTSWEGFDFVVNRRVLDDGRTVLERSSGGWLWDSVGEVRFAVSGNELEVGVPLSALGVDPEGFAIEFKWIDNAVADGDILECMDKGDSAPNGRFRYRYVYKGDK